MARTAWPTVISGDSWTASQHNTYGRDNDLAYWPYTTAGDLAYASSSTTLTRLGVSTNYRILRLISGVPAWSDVMYFASVYRTTNQTFTTGSAANINWTAEELDGVGWHDNVTNNDRLTVDANGWYIPFVQIVWTKASGGAGNFEIISYVAKNGTQTKNRYRNDGFLVSANPKEFTYGGIPLSLSASDYLTVSFYQNSGGSGDISGDISSSFFALLRVA